MWVFKYACVPQCGEIIWKLIHMFGFILISACIASNTNNRWSIIQYFITFARPVTLSWPICPVRASCFNLFCFFCLVKTFLTPWSVMIYICSHSSDTNIYRWSRGDLPALVLDYAYCPPGWVHTISCIYVNYRVYPTVMLFLAISTFI